MSKQLRIAHLTWLREPVQKSVDVSKIQLDTFHKKAAVLAAPAPADAEPVWFDNQRKHRDEAIQRLAGEINHIHAALVVADCIGGSSLAFELKVLVNIIREGQVQPQKIERALVAIHGGLLTIPKYLDMVIDGAPDSVGVLAKQINELREIRGVELLEEDNLLPPGVEFVYVEPPLRDRECSDEQRQIVFQQSAKRFLGAFSTYMAKQSKPALAELQDVLRALQEVTDDIELGCFWWVGGCLLDALDCGAIRSAGDTLSKIRMLSVAIQKLASDGEEAAKGSLGVARFKSLLSVLSMSSKLPPAIETVLAVFNVNTSVDAPTLAELQARLETAGTATIHDVLSELHALVESAMVSLGRAITSRSADGLKEQLARATTSTRQVASVLYMVSESELAAIAANALVRLERIEAREDFTEQLVDSLKDDFIFLDEHIRNQDTKRAIRSLRIEGLNPDVVCSVVAEALKELTLTRRSISAFLHSGGSVEDLTSGLTRLIGTAAALNFSGITQAAGVVKGICQGFMSQMTDRGIDLSPSVELSARALVAVEGYLTALLSNVEPSPLMLTNAEQALAQVGVHVAHVEIAPSSQLLKRFEAARETASQGAHDENHFVSELYDIRKALEGSLTSLSVTDRQYLGKLHTIADRLAMASKLSGVDSLHRLPNALSKYCQYLIGCLTDNSVDRQRVEALITSALELIFRCIDEYSARGKVTIFTHDVEEQLASGLSENPTNPNDTDLREELTITASVEPVLEGELLDRALVDIARELPEGSDATLVELFREEFASNLGILKGLCSAPSPSITREICRAAHTIHGCSGSAECFVLQKVYGALETRFEHLLASGQVLTDDDLSQLRDLLLNTEDFVRDFPWTDTTDRLDAWVTSASEIGVPIEDGAFVELPRPSRSSEHAAGPLSSAPMVDAHKRTSEPPDSSQKFSHAKTFDEQPPESLHPGSGAPKPEYNDQCEFYIEEVDDRLPNLESDVASWLLDMNDQALITSIRRHMHTLKGAAQMAGANAITALTHHMESLFDSLAVKLIVPSDDCARLVAYALDNIRSMTALMRVGAVYQPPVDLIECLEKCIETNRVDLSILVPSEGSASVASEPRMHDEGNVSIDQLEEVKGSIDQPQISKRRKRGGRGKGGVNKHARDSGAQDLNGPPSAGTAALLCPSSVSEAVPAPTGEMLSAEAIDGQPLPAGETIAPAIQPADLGSERPLPDPEKFSHAKTSSVTLGMDTTLFEVTGDVREDQPVVSEAALELIALEQAGLTSASRHANTGTGEKVRVDLRLLEAAGQQASALIALRARLHALNDEANVRLTGARALLEVNSLQHGQLTNALRSYTNSQPTAKGGATADLERFNDLSAMHVVMGAQIDEVLAEINEVFNYMHQMRTALSELQPALTGLQSDLLHSRLVPVNNVRVKLLSAVTQAASVTNKKAVGELEGSQVIMDKMMLDAITDPLTHIIRNAVDHGIEKPAERIDLGKPEQGTVCVSVTRRAKHIIIEVRDDGRGIDVDAVRNKAISMDLIAEDAQLSPAEVLNLITRSGFSTAGKVTQVSGRGVGMDIVASTVESLGGRLRISSEKGEGTTFTIELPFTIGSNKAVIASSGSQWFAIPTYSTTQFLLVPRADLEAERETKGYACVSYEGKVFEVVHLADLVAMPDSRSGDPKGSDATLILCEQGDERIAIEVAKVDSMREIHIRKLQGMLSNVRGIVGETEMQDGSPVFVLDVIEQARLNLKRGSNGYQVRQNRVRSVKREQTKPTVLVVDDSRSYRTQLERILGDFGYTVVTAVDGQAAMRKLMDGHKPDLMLVDVEMPNMDGFQFTEAVRSRDEYASTPLIMITTRTGLELKAKQAGANKYLLKPCDAASLHQAVLEVTRNSVNRDETA